MINGWSNVYYYSRSIDCTTPLVYNCQQSGGSGGSCKREEEERRGVQAIDRSRVVVVHIRPLKHFKTLYGYSFILLQCFEVASLKSAFTHRATFWSIRTFEPEMVAMDNKKIMSDSVILDQAEYSYLLPQVKYVTTTIMCGWSKK